MTKILHILSQRPGRSGSGVFLKAMIKEAANAGYQQHVVAAGPPSTNADELPPLQTSEFSGIFFPDPAAPFPVPGNSDVMPYPSTVFSEMTPLQVQQYLDHSERVLQQVKHQFRPDIVHAHHLWMMTAKAREVFDDTPIVATAHNVGLRLSIKAPHLLPHVHPGIQACDKVCVLTPHSRQQTMESYHVHSDNIAITGAGYQDDHFYYAPRSDQQRQQIQQRWNIDLPDSPSVTFVGRLSTAKGIPFLLQAVARLKAQPNAPQVIKNFKLILVGATGSGSDGEQIKKQVTQISQHVIHLGAQPEQAVADILRCSDLFVLPSLFEGLPLVMLEAVASGCPCVISDLPTIRSWLPRAWQNSDLYKCVTQLQTVKADIPVDNDINRFITDFADAIGQQLTQHPSEAARQQFAEQAKAHSWTNVFRRYQQVYQQLLNRADAA